MPGLAAGWVVISIPIVPAVTIILPPIDLDHFIVRTPLKYGFLVTEGDQCGRVWPAIKMLCSPNPSNGIPVRGIKE